MTIWGTRPVADQPQIWLTHWRIFRLHDGTFRAVGYNPAGGEGRVSNQFVAFDPAGVRVRTRTGRIYQLDGESGWHGDAEYVLRQWCAVYDLDPDTLEFVLIDELSGLPSIE